MSSKSNSRLGELKRGTDSGASSRSLSRVMTPDEGDPVGPMEQFALQNLENMLNELLLQDDEIDMPENQKEAERLNLKKLQSNQSSINEIVYSLGMGRTNVSSRSRELLLANLYNLIVRKPLLIQNEQNQDTANFVTEETVQDLLAHLVKKNYRSPTEFILLYRCCLALLASDIEEFGELLTSDLEQTIVGFIDYHSGSSVDASNKANVLSGFAALLLIYHNGSYSNSIIEYINWFLEIAESYATSARIKQEKFNVGDREYSTLITNENADKVLAQEAQKAANSEADVSVAALNGAACLLTLIRRGSYLNDYLTELMPRVIALLEADNLNIFKSVGLFTGLAYEIFTYDEDQENDDEDYNYNSPYYEQAQLMSEMERLANLTSHKYSKKSKKEVHSIFRDILNTIEVYTNIHDRNEVYKRSPEGIEKLRSCFEPIYLRLRKSKPITIGSWFLYIRWFHLKFIFSHGTTAQLAKNSEVRDTLREPATEYQKKYGIDEEEIFQDVDSYYKDPNKQALDEKKRSEILRRARKDKDSQLQIFE